MPTADRKSYAYHRAHHRVRERWGKAKEHLCIDCLGPAAQWATIVTTNSTFYRPMCVPCHVRLDKVGVKRGPYRKGRYIPISYKHLEEVS